MAGAAQCGGRVGSAAGRDDREGPGRGSGVPLRDAAAGRAPAAGRRAPALRRGDACAQARAPARPCGAGRQDRRRPERPARSSLLARLWPVLAPEFHAAAGICRRAARTVGGRGRPLAPQDGRELRRRRDSRELARPCARAAPGSSDTAAHPAARCGLASRRPFRRACTGWRRSRPRRTTGLPASSSTGRAKRRATSELSCTGICSAWPRKALRAGVPLE